MKLLLISNSASPGESYLEKAKEDLARLISTPEERKNVILIPYAAVTYSFDEYVTKVNDALREVGIVVHGVHEASNPIEAVRNASAILVGGGNTWQLTRMMQEQGLMEVIRRRVKEEGIPYSGWSAGSNVACPTLSTTNDMPITEPQSFQALRLVPFQINPHYLDAHPSNHGGETREMRIQEYIIANPDVYVVGLREGSRLLVTDDSIELRGERKMRLFHYGAEPREVTPGEDIAFLLSGTPQAK